MVSNAEKFEQSTNRVLASFGTVVMFGVFALVGYFIAAEMSVTAGWIVGAVIALIGLYAIVANSRLARLLRIPGELFVFFTRVGGWFK